MAEPFILVDQILIILVAGIVAEVVARANRSAAIRIIVTNYALREIEKTEEQADT